MNLFLHDGTISSFVHVSWFLIGKRALIENMLILKKKFLELQMHLDQPLYYNKLCELSEIRSGGK